MRIQGFHHLAILAHDVERVTSFYRDVLGLAEQVRHFRPDGVLRSVWLTLGEGQGFLAVELAAGKPPPGRPFRTDDPGLLLIALRIPREDRAAVLEALARAQVPVLHQSRWTVYVQDPEGNRVALSHHPSDPLP